MILVVVVSTFVAYPVAVGLWLGGASLTFSLVAFYCMALAAPVLLAARTLWRVRA